MPLGITEREVGGGAAGPALQSSIRIAICSVYPNFKEQVAEFTLLLLLLGLY